MEMSVFQTGVTHLAPCSGTAFRLAARSALRVIDLEGEQVADVVLFSASDVREVLSNGRTFDYASSVRISRGSVLYSNRSRMMATIVRDDVGVHDFLLTPCSRDTWRICYGDSADERPGCFGNLASALEPYGIAADAIPTTFNCFMNVAMDECGALRVRPPVSKAGEAIEFRAEMDLIVGLTSCSAAQSNNGRYKPIGFEILES